MKKIDITTKTKAIFLGILVIVSIALAFSNIYKSKNDLNSEMGDYNGVRNENFVEIETKEEDIIDTDITPNYTNDDTKTVWIKNITFLSEQGETYATLMKLKNKLNTELRIVNEDIYEVELLEDSYEKIEEGFIIKAKVDTIDYIVKINYSNCEFNFILEE